MTKVDPLSLIVGIIFAFGGVLLLTFSILFNFSAIYGIVSLIIGIIILLTIRQQEYVG